jgi:hypothetical protein
LNARAHASAGLARQPLPTPESSPDPKPGPVAAGAKHAKVAGAKVCQIASTALPSSPASIREPTAASMPARPTKRSRILHRRLRRRPVAHDAGGRRRRHAPPSAVTACPHE